MQQVNKAFNSMKFRNRKSSSAAQGCRSWNQIFFSPIISQYFVVSSIYISHQARLGIPSWSTPRNLSLPNKKQKSHRAHLGITLIEHISEIREEFPKIVTVSTLNPCLPLVFHFLFFVIFVTKFCLCVNTSPSSKKFSENSLSNNPKACTSN